MAKTATINSRIAPELKAEVEKIFRKLGLSTSEAITLFYNQVNLNNGLPFEVKIPNKETIEAMEELENGGGIEYDSFESFKKDFDSL